MGERDDAGAREWHLDKRVPIALIGAIFLQTGAALWWASALSTRVEQLERANVMQSGQDARIVRLETKMDLIGQSLVEIKSILIRGHAAP